MSVATPSRTSRRSRKPQRPAWVRWGAWIGGGLFVAVVLGLLAWQLLSAREHFTAAEQVGRQAQQALLAGDLDDATEAFAAAAQSFGRADERLAAPPAALVRVVPVLGNTVRTLAVMAGAGQQATAAVSDLVGEVASLPGGIAALAPSDGVIPLEPLDVLAAPLREAAAQLAGARDELGAAPDTWLLGPVGTAHGQLGEQVAGLASAVEAGAVLADALPGFLGADGPRRYFFGPQNPSDIRGTGGFLSQYALMTADAGRVTFGDFTTVTDLNPEDRWALTGPDADYEARYGIWGAAGYLQNINRTPHVPAAAQAIVALHEHSTGERIDGVVLADPWAYEAMLELTGPVDVPDVRTLDAGSVVSFIPHGQYLEFGDELAEDRKPVMGEVARTVIERYLAGTGSPIRSLQTLVETAGAGHVLLYSADEVEQSAFVQARVAGSFTPRPQGDLLAVIANGRSATKLDHYLEQEVTYDVYLEADGSAYTQARVRLTNPAPDDGLPPLVIGPFDDEFVAGEHRVDLAVHRPGGLLLARHTHDDAARLPEVEPEYDTDAWLALPRVRSRQTTELRWDWYGTWARASGTYRLTVRGQHTVQPTRLTVRVHAPAGMTAQPPSDRGYHEGGAAVWEGVIHPARTLDFPVGWPGGRGVWERVLQALRRPVL